MNSPARDVRDILATAGLAAGGWTLGFGNMPPASNGTERYVCIYDTGGFSPDIHIRLDKPTVQVRIRGQNGKYELAYAQALACREALLGYARKTVGGTYYLAISGMGDVALLEYDDGGRPIFFWNAMLWRQPSTSTYRV